jgi:hypothetical protein
MYFSYVRHTQGCTKLLKQLQYVKDFSDRSVGLLQNEVLDRLLIIPVYKEDDMPIHAGYYTLLIHNIRHSHQSYGRFASDFSGVLRLLIEN